MVEHRSILSSNVRSQNLQPRMPLEILAELFEGLLVEGGEESGCASEESVHKGTQNMNIKQ